MNKKQTSTRNQKPRREAKHEPEPGSTLQDPLFNVDALPAGWEGRPPRDELYSFAVKQLATLAALCPEFAVRMRAAEFLVNEFRPVQPGGSTELQQFKLELRRTIEQFSPREALVEPAEVIELETERRGSAAERE